MSLRSLEAQILAELRHTTGIRKIRQMDITEWSTADIEPQEGETLVRLELLKINVTYKLPEKKAKA